ncbi:MAG: RsiV family protein [Bacillota bacterium]|nr:RsiV family protein [Bacillota bacterium]
MRIFTENKKETDETPAKNPHSILRVMLMITEPIDNKVIEDEMRYKDAVVLSYSVSCPEMGSGEGFERVGGYYENRTAKMIRYIKNRLYRESAARCRRSALKRIPFAKSVFHSEFYETYVSDTVLSIYEDEFEGIYGAEGRTLRSAQNWFLPKGRKMRLGEFFVRKTKWKNIFIGSIAGEIPARIQEGKDQAFFGNWELLIRRHFNPNNFYLSEEGFTVFYQEAAIAPFEAGIITFTVPYGAFGNSLAFKLQGDIYENEMI